MEIFKVNLAKKLKEAPIGVYRKNRTFSLLPQYTDGYVAEKNKYIKFDESNIIHISQVDYVLLVHKVVCETRFEYSGIKDILVNPVVKNFEERYGVTMTHTNSFVIGTENSFNEGSSPKFCGLLYTIDDEHFYLVHTWGDDIFIGRFLLYFYESQILRWLLSVILALKILSFFPIFTLIILCYLLISFFAVVTDFFENGIY